MRHRTRAALAAALLGLTELAPTGAAALPGCADFAANSAANSAYDLAETVMGPTRVKPMSCATNSERDTRTRPVGRSIPTTSASKGEVPAIEPSKHTAQ